MTTISKLLLSLSVAIPLAGDSKPLFIGDSLTYELALSYKKTAPVDAKFRESTGLKSTQYLDWLQYAQHIDFSRYDTVYIVLGTNDFISQPEIPAYRQKARCFITAVRQHNDNVVWLLPPALNDRHKNTLLNNTRNAIQRAAYQEGIRTLDMRKSLGTDYRASVNGVLVRTHDGIHITSQGADLVTSEIFRSEIN